MPRTKVDLLRAACCVAGLDREICEKERPLLEMMAEQAGVGRASLEAMLSRAERDPNFYHEQFELLQSDPDRALKMMFAIAIADHDLTLNERVILQHFADKLGVDEARCNQLLKAAERKVAEQAEGSDVSSS